MPTEHLDLDRYLARIEYRGDRAPTEDVLRALHLAHATHVPFENLDILLGQPIRLELEHLERKLVSDRRGGYCFEHNLLFAHVLERLGFSVTRLAARVRFGAIRLTPRTHMVLSVDIGGRSWLADVGFGGQGPWVPVPLSDGQVAEEFGWRFRVERKGEAWLLRARGSEDWQDFYTFTMEPQHPVDYEVASHYTSTHPSSHFVQLLTVQLPTRTARYRLINHTLTIYRDGGREERILRDDKELLGVLAETFGMRFPAGTRFRIPPKAEPGL